MVREGGREYKQHGALVFFHKMQDYKFFQAEEFFFSKIALFDPPGKDTAIWEHEQIHYYPKDAISPEAPIVFRIDPSSGKYLNGSTTTMTLELKIFGEDNEPITSHVQAELNGVEVNPDVTCTHASSKWWMRLMDSLYKKLSTNQQKG